MTMTVEPPSRRGSPAHPGSSSVFEWVLGLAGGEMSTVDHAIDARLNPVGEGTTGVTYSGYWPPLDRWLVRGGFR